MGCVCTLKSTSSPPSCMKPLISPAHLSSCSSWQASRRVGLAAAAPATGMFEEGCSIPGGETWRWRWLPRQGKGDAETDGCVHREHCLCGEQHVGGCTTQSCSPSNSPDWITPVGTYTMIIISFPVRLCQYGVATQPLTSRRAVSLLSTLWF